MLKTLSFFLFFLINMQIIGQTILINELMSSNSSKLKDEDNDYSDWIEIYNAGSSSVNLQGFALSDDKDLPLKWVFPEVSLEPHSFLYVFASGKDRTTTPGKLHTNFKIEADGEVIYLCNSSGVVLDSTSSVYVPDDLSYGRKPDGSQNWFYFSEPTAGTSNNNSTEFTGYADSVIASSQGGLFNSPVSLTLSVPGSGAKIYYTLTGDEPTKNSTLYSAPIQINSTSIIRASAFEDSKLPGPIKTITFLINENLYLPVISITTEPKNLWDQKTGIYVNYEEDWEKPAHLEFFETDGSKVLDQDFGLQIFGTYTSRFPQKSLALMARNKYGKGKFKYKIFNDLDIDEFDSFVLRNGGNDWGYSIMRDAMVQRLIRENTDLDYLEYRPSVVFLNGMYWGIYNIREKVNEDYLAAHHNLNPDDINILENNGRLLEGDSTHYWNMLDYIAAHSVKSDPDYEYIKTQMDVDNYLDYVITQIYAANTDWPGNNIKFWRTNESDSRWKWVLFGTEFSFGLYYNIKTIPTANTLQKATASSNFEWFNPEWSTFLLRKMLENENFKEEFIKRFADHLNITFKPERVKNIIAEMKAGIEPEMPRNISRWAPEGAFGSFSNWIYETDVLNDFADQRPENVRDHIRNQFGLRGTANLNYNIQPSGAGKIKTNRLIIPEESWQGIYFAGTPITITAIPMPGYKFKEWSGASTSPDPVISLVFSSDKSLTAVFEKSGNDNNNNIVINEINYNSPDDHDSEDWIELFNNNDTDTNIGGWIIKGEGSANLYVIPENTIIKANSYFVICRNKAAFSDFFPSVTNVIGDLSFGFSSGGELIQLLDLNEVFVDSVRFDDKSPWPTEPDGNGATLELKDPALDNSIAENWAASKIMYGTPGSANSSMVDVKEPDESPKILSYNLEQNYPNPFNPVTVIGYQLSVISHTTLKIYDVLGNEVATLVNEQKQPGYYHVKFDGSNLSSGVYFYRIEAGEFTATKKFILMK